jgi:Protein of unknown function (DUF1629)
MRRRFYAVRFQVGPRGSGFRLLNDERLFSSGGPLTFVQPPGQRGFRNYPETPVFLADSKLGRTHRDFEGYSGYWFISDHMKSVLESVDRGAFVFLRCDMRSPDGQKLPARWLCDVIRVLDALDEEKSTARIGIADDGSKVYRILGREKLIFKEEVVGQFHVFSMKYHGFIICDEEMKKACKSAEVTGLSFQSTD